MHPTGRFLQLLQQYTEGVLNAEEEQEFVSLLQSGQYRAWLDLDIRDRLQQDYPDHLLGEIAETRTDSILENIFRSGGVQEKPIARRIPVMRTAWFRYAAVLLLILGAGAYIWFNNKKQQTIISDNRYLSSEIKPGKEGAILTLADGSKVVLDSLGNGIIADQNGARVVLNNGQLVYDATGKTAGEMLYNTMTTPKGRQFRVTLPDGTRVWLNAASSLRYPTVFTGKERRVEITGEAYFEVTQDKSKPFFVRVNNTTSIEVLGTSFNVNAYEDETSIRTTLLEGSIRASVVVADKAGEKVALRADRPKNVENVILKPGQQAQIFNTRVGQHTQSGIIVDSNADLEKVMAWKNGAFNFQDASLQEVMRQLERWYNLEVVYEKGIPDIHFVGGMSRDVSLTELIKVLEASKVHFRLEEGRRLVVMP